MVDEGLNGHYILLGGNNQQPTATAGKQKNH